MKVLAFCFNVIWWRSVAVSMDQSKLVGGRWGGDSMVVGCNKTHQITFFVVTLYIFHVFLKVFIWILNLYFCFYLDDLDTGDSIDDITAIDDITKYKLLANHFKPDDNYKFPSKFQHGCMRALAYHWLASFPFLVYSKRHYSVFRLPCTLFDKEISQKSKISKNTGFSSWLVRRFQSICVVKKLVKRTSIITLSIF